MNVPYIYLLMLVSTAAAEKEQITSSLDEIKSVLSTVIDTINEMQKDQARKHAETLLWHQNTVSLLTELKRCCHDNITATCVNPTYKSTPTTQLPTTPATSTTLTCTTPTTLTTATPALQDCKTVDQRGAFKDGVYQLLAGNQQIQVYCAGGYVTFQRRYNGQLKFDKTFSEYEQGFGVVSSEHWMGLRYLHLMTKDRRCTFRARLAVDYSRINARKCTRRYMSDCNGQVKEVLARDFRVSSAADKYRVQFLFNRTDFLQPNVHRYTKYLNGQRFTTKDQDNDQWSGGNCALQDLEVDGGFWYSRSCALVYPNSVWSKERRCSTSVCGMWYPYLISSSLLQFSC